MAPMKRQHTGADDDEFDLVGVESASANLQAASRKKARTSGSDILSDDSGRNTDDESFLEQATQFVSTQKTKDKVRNVPADNGVIESVTCINFMCHKHFDVRLGPLINFITGHNGSGKSAILTAITICLGGKATSTNRGGSLKSFIMNGQESAMLSVKLKNTSDTAYQPDVYGDSVTVERHFSRSGASGFKLKSASGRIISTRKGDLDDICDYFALQIDNPMNVLTQDMARQFLNNSSPSEKYKFFMKGTQLEHLDGDYLVVEQNVETIDSDLWKKQQDVALFKEEAEKAANLHRISQKNDELRAKIQHFSHMMAWAQVEEQEERLRAYDRRLDKKDENIQRLESECTSLGEGYRQSDEANEVATRTVQEAEDALTPLKDEKAKVKETHEQYKTEQVEIQAQQRLISNELKGAQTRISKIESDIKDEHRRLADADGGRHADKRREIEEKKEALQEAKDRLRAHEDELPNLNEEKTRAIRELDNSKKPIQGKRREIETNENNAAQLIRDRGKLQNAFPASMPRLLSTIQQDNAFREKPIGPLGKHVRLLKPMWSSILEKQFGSALDSFIVTSKDDQSRLLSHMQKIKCVCPILIGNHHPIDTSGHEPDSEFETPLRVLEIDNDLVRKQLVIGQAIDQTILVEKRDEAIKLMNRSRLNNVKQCFTLNVDPGTGCRLGYGYGGGLSETFVPRFQGIPRMKTDIEYQIRAQQEIVQQLRTELHHLEEASREKQTLTVRCDQAIVRHKRATGSLRVEAQSIQSTLEEMQDALDGESIEEGRLDSLKDALREAQDENATHESSYEDSINAKDQVYEKVRATRDEMANMDKVIQEAETRLTRAETRQTQRAQQREQALREKNRAEDQVQEAKAERAQFAEERQELVGIIEDWTRQASEISSRVAVDPGETSESVQKKYDKLNSDLTRAEHRLGGSREKIAEDAARAHEAFQRAKDEVTNAEELVQLLKTTLINRRERWKRFQKYITSRARIQFFYQLSERGFRGKLLANHKEKKLDLQVEPDETRSQAKGRSTHGLSGGEKSFSTICLLLSMWEAMGAPVRCLDEFDVFMDSVNRDVSMDMLVRFARDSVGKQFILITPQNMGKINLQDEDINVVKMRDPIRAGQQTLDSVIAAA